MQWLHTYPRGITGFEQRVEWTAKQFESEFGYKPTMIYCDPTEPDYRQRINGYEVMKDPIMGGRTANNFLAIG